MSPAETSAISVRLRPGEVRLHPLQSGTRVQVLCGYLHLVEPSQWIGGHASPQEAHLSGGSGHTVRRTGWVQLRADGPTEVHCTLSRSH